MSTDTTNRIEGREGRAGASRSEPGGRAERDAGGVLAGQSPAIAGLPDEVRGRLSDELIDELLAGAR